MAKNRKSNENTRKFEIGDTDLEVTMKVYPIESKHTLAMVQLVFGDCFMVASIALKDGRNGKWLAFPQYQKNNGEYVGIAYPLTKELRDKLTDCAVDIYEYLTD